MDAILQNVYDYIIHNNLLQCGDSVLVSVSAGKDSTALLDILYRLREKLGITIAVYHLDHRVRGDESFGDVLFVIKRAAEFGISAFVEQYDFSNKKDKGKSFEQQARDYRYMRLHAIAREYGFNKIATAHTKDDQIETLFMRIFQGTGLPGLRGIPVQNGMIIRPLLNLSVEDVYAYLQYAGLSYRYDYTNDDTYYLRNYVRHQILPHVKRRFPHYENALLNLQKQAIDAVESIHTLIHRLYTGFVTEESGYIRVREDAISLNEYIFKFYCVFIISNYLTKNIDTDIANALYHAHQSKRKNITLFEGNGIYVYRRILNNNSYLVFSSKPLGADQLFEYTLIPGTTIHIKEAGLYIECTITDSLNTVQLEDTRTIILRYSGDSNIVIRNKREGDTIVRKSGSRTLKRLFIDYKLNPEQKQKVPLIVINNTVAAVLFDVVIDKKAEISAPFLPQDNEKMLVIRYW